jgi:hypothetical protein
MPTDIASRVREIADDCRRDNRRAIYIYMADDLNALADELDQKATALMGYHVSPDRDADYFKYLAASIGTVSK